MNPLTIGFALFLVWQNASLSFLFPSSADKAISPLLVGSVSVAFLLAFCVFSYKRDAGTFTPAWSIGLSFLATVAACVASVLVAQTLLPLWGIYVAAAVLGFVAAAVAFVWAMAFSERSSSDTLIGVCFAFFLSSVIDRIAMSSGYFTIPVTVVACGAISWICYVLAIRAKPLDERPLLVRPTNTLEFVKLGVGVAIFAVALGIVAGTTADVATEDSMRGLNANTATAAIVVSCACFVAAVVFRKRIEAISLIKVFAPCLVAVILCNIVDLGRSDIWLALTIFSWAFLRLCVFLVLVEIDRHRIVGLPMVFPAVWTALWWGYAGGVFIGQNILPLAGSGTQAIMNSVVLVAVLVVLGAVLLVGSRLTMRLSEDEASDGEARAAQGQSGERIRAGEQDERRGVPGANAVAEVSGLPFDATGVPRDTGVVESLEDRCARIAAKFQLSARESEVFVLLAQGHTRASIAKKLFVSENTIREHVKNIYKKLYIHSRQQLIDMVDARR
ncbi:helix-turn-helix transcriptional regulator [Raoultibacter phocaeensis]|uniref:helix-turn-helix transcriptional regulator n=1 Tax=Raoultibacter phocaeensis TaxID=2479841 RepID=UPI00111B8EAF|nr:helix-turn-helix transcriptional regulator [Raoultibacter phocaeensis]